jgi:hypothetical protein
MNEYSRTENLEAVSEQTRHNCPSFSAALLYSGLDAMGSGIYRLGSVVYVNDQINALDALPPEK